MSILADTLSIPPARPLTPSRAVAARPHPAFCDRRCAVRWLDDRPLLVHRGEHYRDQWRAIVLMQNELLSGDLSEVVTTYRPMVCMEGDFAAPLTPERAGDVGYALWTAPHAADRAALPITDVTLLVGGAR